MITTKQVFEMGGPGTYCHRFFVHMECVELPYTTSKKVVVTREDFCKDHEKCVPLVDLADFNCKLCGGPMLERGRWKS